jgi:hypothetical protein
MDEVMVTQGGRTHARAAGRWRGLLGGHRSRPTPPPPGWASAIDPAALAAFGARDLAGDNPFSANVLGPLAALRQAVAEHRGTPEESNLLAGLAAAGTTSWAAVGVWRFVAYFGPGHWRHDRRLQESFLIGLRAVASELLPAARYHADEIEERLIRTAEPTGGECWVILPRHVAERRPTDTTPSTDIEIGDRHLIATFGGNELLATRTSDDAYVAVLARRRGTYDRRVNDEPFASAATWTGLLTAVGRKIGQPGATMWVSEALSPYVTRVMPEWWTER